MTDKQVIYNCPHISLTDWGTYACKLYNPRDKNCLVKGGNCVSNISCPYKQSRAKEQECEELKEQFKLAEPLYQACNIKDKKINKLRQTLTGIREIAERCGKRIPLFEIDEIAEDLKQILQKISEVIPDEN